MRLLFLLPFMALLLAGCGTYETPPPRACLNALAEPSLKKAYGARPLAKFPAALAVVRLQGNGRCAGSDSMQLSLDTEKTKERLSRLPGVSGVVRLNKLVLADEIKSDVDVRTAAAKLHADLLLLYTVDTTFRTNDRMGLLTVCSLGLLPTFHYETRSTVAGVLMDTQSGYIYGAVEEEATRSGMSNGWFKAWIQDGSAARTQQDAFGKALTSFEELWKRVYAKSKR